MKKYVDFELAESKPKTVVYRVVSTKSARETLGRIYWYWPWRQYVFQPEPETIWSRGCWKQVFDFIEELMEARKKE